MEPKNLALVGMILGLVSLILAFVLGLIAPYIALILGVVGLILSAKANKVEKSGIGTAGFVLSIIGIVISAIWLITWIACIAAVGSYIGTAEGAAAWSELQDSIASMG